MVSTVCGKLCLMPLGKAGPPTGMLDDNQAISATVLHPTGTQAWRRRAGRFGPEQRFLTLEACLKVLECLLERIYEASLC